LFESGQTICKHKIFWLHTHTNYTNSWVLRQHTIATAVEGILLHLCIKWTTKTDCSNYSVLSLL